MLSNVGEFVFACLGESPVARLVFLNESGFGEFGDVAVGEYSAFGFALESHEFVDCGFVPVDVAHFLLLGFHIFV